jgi:hypothetical protein
MKKKQSKHVGMWLDVDGEPVHMLADPNMSEETKNALAELVRLVREMPHAPLDDWDNLRVCVRCGQYETTAPDSVCWRCKQQEIIDEVG